MSAGVDAALVAYPFPGWATVSAPDRGWKPTPGRLFQNRSILRQGPAVDPRPRTSCRRTGVQKVRPPFAYYGGKTKLTATIAALLPEHRHATGSRRASPLPPGSPPVLSGLRPVSRSRPSP